MNTIEVETVVNSPVEKVWEYWTRPEHVTSWNHASDDWYCPEAKNDLRVGGSFSFIMSSRDGTNSFDFSGIYSRVEDFKEINYSLGDNREVQVIFEKMGESSTRVTEIFEAETENSEDLQRSGWQSIIDNFKNYTETN